MLFDKSFIEEIKQRVNTSEVVRRKVQLKSKGQESSGLCPFHKEKTPSFTVNDDKGFYHCFGCGAHGNIFDFIMRTEGLNFPEAIERLALDAGMQLPTRDPQQAQRYEKYDRLMKCAEEACQWFQHNLNTAQGAKARDYIKERGLSSEITEQFRLGYMEDKQGLMQRHLESKGFTLQEIQETGLIKNGYEYFRGRLIFPITNAKGQAIAFGGRILGEGEPKYLNSPETEIFIKRKTLFGKAIARKAAYESGEIIVAEGYMDVIALNAAGFKNAVAPLGTSITTEHVEELWRMSKEPTLCFDGDRAGQAAMVRAANLVVPMLKPGLSLKFVMLPEGQDPDDILRADRALFRKLLDNALPLSEILYKNEKAKSSLTTPEQQADFKKRLYDLAGQIPDKNISQSYQRFFADKFWKDSNQYKGKANNKAPKSSKIIAISTQSAEKKRHLELEASLLGSVIVAPELLNNIEIEEEFAKFDFSELEFDKFRTNILQDVFLNGDLVDDSEGVLQNLVAGLDNRLQKHIEIGIKYTQRIGSAKSAWNNILEQLTEHNIKAERETMHIGSEEEFSMLRQKFNKLVESQEKINAEQD